MSFANLRIMSARMSLSENTAAKRMAGLACAQAGTTDAAARAVPALSAARRSILKFIFNLILCFLQVAKNHFRDHFAPPADIALGAHLALEDGGEGVPVGDVEHAERGD